MTQSLSLSATKCCTPRRDQLIANQVHSVRGRLERLHEAMISSIRKTELTVNSPDIVLNNC